MPRPVPGTGPDDGGQAASPAGGAFPPASGAFPPAGGPASPAGGAFPPADRPASCAGDPAPSFDGFAPGAGGTAWPDGLDYQALLDGLAASGFLGGRMEDQDAVLAEEIAAAEEGRMLPADSAWVAGLAALAAEYMEPGPSQAGWLEVAMAEAGRLDENALAGLAAGAQKLVSHGQVDRAGRGGADHRPRGRRRPQDRCGRPMGVRCGCARTA